MTFLFSVQGLQGLQGFCFESKRIIAFSERFVFMLAMVVLFSQKVNKQ
jgi:hypothetical protein